MTDLARRLQSAGDKVERLKADLARVEGRRDAALGALEKEFGVSTLAEAKKLLTKLERKEKKASDALADVVEEIEQELDE